MKRVLVLEHDSSQREPLVLSFSATTDWKVSQKTRYRRGELPEYKAFAPDVMVIDMLLDHVNREAAPQGYDLLEDLVNLHYHFVNGVLDYADPCYVRNCDQPNVKDKWIEYVRVILYSEMREKDLPKNSKEKIRHARAEGCGNIKYVDKEIVWKRSDLFPKVPNRKTPLEIVPVANSLLETNWNPLIEGVVDIDGKDTASCSRGQYVRIEGRHLRIHEPVGLGEVPCGLGVFFCNARYQILAGESLMIQGGIISRVPPGIAPGKYRIEAVTRPHGGVPHTSRSNEIRIDVL